jgi:ankyrin repeat protein
MANNDSDKIIAAMTNSYEERGVRFKAIMKATREGVLAEAEKGNDARAGLAGTLFEAAVAGDLRMVTRCLDLGIDPSWPRRNGTDVLRDIVGMGDARLDIIKLLISRGADPNVGNVPMLRQIQASAYCDNEATIAFLRSINARE